MLESERHSDPLGADFWRVEPPVGRMADGVPRRVDRLRALGNAVVPAQAYPILSAIAQEIQGATSKRGAEQ
ncbi:MAG: hypothetical protein EOP83_28485 [Verrucomicrobiaceae bacterium]|nr:MAG: hypothetical protein EOP83_28485 [Verrucomicrobiaceae bacterium]